MESNQVLYILVAVEALIICGLLFVNYQQARGLAVSIPPAAFPIILNFIREVVKLTPTKSDDQLLGTLFPEGATENLKLTAEPLRYGTLVTRDELEAFGNQIVRRAQEGTPLPERTRQALAENPPRTADSAPAQEEAAPFQPGDKAILG